MSGNLEFPMNGGDGANSYSKNSRYQLPLVNGLSLGEAFDDGNNNIYKFGLFLQGEAINVVKEMIIEAIAKKFDITSLSFSSNTIRIADLGCSVGPNIFNAMKSILEATEWKYHSKNLATEMPEFQLFFNNHAFNDFNTLFTTLPPDRQYFAAGVPVPEELLDNGSLAWNKGKIHYTIASKEIANVYASQFAEDMDTFFNARADEIIVGGMMILIMPGLADGIQYSQDPFRPLLSELEKGSGGRVTISIVGLNQNQTVM
ncbi:hypothetical protein ACSBR1_005982 [Camellia fascicularis]